MNHFVYITTNSLNGKQYVGDHSTDNLNDSYLGSGKILLKAVKKYGSENFSRKILEQFNTKEGAVDSQEIYIKKFKKFNTLIPNGYNISPSGGVHWGGVHSEESKQLMSKTKKENGFTPWNKGLNDCYSNKTKNLWSKQRKGRKLSDQAKEKVSKFNKGKILSKETKQKQSESHIGKKNPMYGKPAWDVINIIKKKCEYCGKETNLGNYGRWHGEKCKHKF